MSSNLTVAEGLARACDEATDRVGELELTYGVSDEGEWWWIITVGVYYRDTGWESQDVDCRDGYATLFDAVQHGRHVAKVLAAQEAVNEAQLAVHLAQYDLHLASEPLPSD